MGHEAMGYVAQAGRNVKDFTVGDRMTGLGGGGYCEYIVMEPAKMMLIPAGLADEDAIVEPLGCLMSGAERMLPQTPGDTVVVVGTGYMGLGMVSLFRALGYAEVIAVDRRALDLIDRVQWKFRGALTHIYTLEEFDRANREMADHTDNFIKGAVICE